MFYRIKESRLYDSLGTPTEAMGIALSLSAVYARDWDAFAVFFGVMVLAPLALTVYREWKWSG